MILFFTFTASVFFLEILKRSLMLQQKLEMVSLTTKV
ncbi:MAG: hypothetical protein UX89_C0018G0008 [Parcubacteria group bacterium GW2011_GWA2_47_16]|nr:MAG: hypothetical protein UX89_C0018G0008 [Parcubacteria group bacterium GW2011_GWA2_47_16]